jgi:hypothetical protein
MLWQAVTQRTALDADEIAGGFIGTDLGGWFAVSAVAVAPALICPTQIRRDQAARQRLRALVTTLLRGSPQGRCG